MVFAGCVQSHAQTKGEASHELGTRLTHYGSL